MTGRDLMESPFALRSVAQFLCGTSLVLTLFPHYMLAWLLVGQEHRKDKYSNLGDQYRFVLLAVETSGSFGLAAMLFIKELLGRRIRESIGEIKYYFKKMLMEALCCGLVNLSCLFSFNYHVFILVLSYFHFCHILT